MACIFVHDYRYVFQVLAEIIFSLLITDRKPFSGWFLLLSSVIGYWRVKRWERSIRSVAASTPVTPEDIERDIAMRRNLESVFGISFVEEENRDRRAREAYANAQEERLTRDLRAAGLI